MTVRAIIWTYKPRRDGSCNIKIYWQHEGKKGYIKTEYYVTPSDWDEVKGLVRRSNPLHTQYNSRIQGEVLRLQSEILAGQSPDGKKQSKSLIAFVGSYIDEVERGIHDIAEGTCRQYKTHLTRLKGYKAQVGKDIDFEDVDTDFYLGFSDYLKQVGCNLPGIGKHTKILKKMMNEALQRGLHKNTAHQGKIFKGHQPNLSDKIYLNTKEIEAFASVDLRDKPDLLREQRRFLVSYYLVLRYSDSVNLQSDNFIEKDGRRFYINKAQKTGSMNYVPVKQAAWEIIQAANFDLGGDTNQEANRKIKTISAMASIDTVVDVGSEKGPKWMYVTTHTARRSAATNLHLQGADLKVIASLGGWQSEKTLKAYLLAGGLDLAQKAADMEFFQ